MALVNGRATPYHPPEKRAKKGTRARRCYWCKANVPGSQQLLGAKVREAGRLMPIPFSPLSSHHEMTGMGFQSPQSSFPSFSAAAISTCPSTSVTLEISRCGRPCPGRLHANTRNHNHNTRAAHGTLDAHPHTMSIVKMLLLPAPTRLRFGARLDWCREATGTEMSA